MAAFFALQIPLYSFTTLLKVHNLPNYKTYEPTFANFAPQPGVGQR